MNEDAKLFSFRSEIFIQNNEEERENFLLSIRVSNTIANSSNNNDHKKYMALILWYLEGEMISTGRRYFIDTLKQYIENMLASIGLQ